MQAKKVQPDHPRWVGAVLRQNIDIEIGRVTGDNCIVPQHGLSYQIGI